LQGYYYGLKVACIDGEVRKQKEILMTKEEKIALRNKASEAYYEGEPIISDEEFDALEREIGDDGRVGHGYVPKSNKFEHKYHVGSLDKVFDLNNLSHID